MNELVKFDTPELELIEKSKAEQIKHTFEPMIKMLSNFEDAYDEVIAEAKEDITMEVTQKAKRVRLDIGKVRIETEKLRKAQKEEYLRAGKAIDGVSNILKWAVVDKENKLKEIENHFEELERKRIEDLQNTRAKLLSNYIEDANERNLAGMDDDVWVAYLSAKKKEYEDRIKAEKEAEAERILKEKKEAEEKERIKKENERLKREAEERERLAKIEEEKRVKAEAERKAKEEAERKEREEKARKEREAFEAELKAEREAKEKVEREERGKREKLEAELKAKEEAELKEKERIEAEKQAELKKGDADKIKDLILDLEGIKGKYTFKSKDNQAMFDTVKKDLNSIIAYIEEV